MAKSFTPVTQSGKVAAPVAAKSTLINSGSQPIFLTDDDSDKALESLDETKKSAVLNALYAIQPGQAYSLKAGTYNLNLGYGFSGSAVLFIETSN